MPFCIFEIFEIGLHDKRLFVFVGIFYTHPAPAPGPISPTPGTPEKREEPGRKGQKKKRLHTEPGEDQKKGTLI